MPWRILGSRLVAFALVAIVVAVAVAPAAAAAPRRDTSAPATERTATPQVDDLVLTSIAADRDAVRALGPTSTTTTGANASVRDKGPQSGQTDQIEPGPASISIAVSTGVQTDTESSASTATDSATPVSTVVARSSVRADEDSALPPDTAARPAPVVRTQAPTVAREARAAIEVTSPPRARQAATTPARQPATTPARQPAPRQAGAWPPRLDEPIMRWLPELYAASTATGVPPRILAGIMRLESSGDPNAISVSGARGLMQIMPYHLEYQGIPRARWHDPATNIRAGATLLASFESKDWRSNVGRYFGAGCDAYGTCTDVYIQVVFRWIEHYAPIVRNPLRSGLRVLPPNWQPPRIAPEVDDYPAVQAPRDTRYMPAGTTPIPSSAANARQNRPQTPAPARPTSAPRTATSAPTPGLTELPAVIDPPPTAEAASPAPTETAAEPPTETATSEPTAAPTAEPTSETPPAATAEPPTDEATSDSEPASEGEDSPQEQLLKKIDELRNSEVEPTEVG